MILKRPTSTFQDWVNTNVNEALELDWNDPEIIRWQRDFLFAMFMRDGLAEGLPRSTVCKFAKATTDHYYSMALEHLRKKQQGAADSDDLPPEWQPMTITGWARRH